MSVGAPAQGEAKGLIDIKKELEQIIEYIQINFTTNKYMNFDEKKDKKKVKLGIKKKKLTKLEEYNDIKNKSEISLKENENDKIVLKNKKLKAKINKIYRLY